MKKIYVSGAITGRVFEEAERQFAETAKMLTEEGYEVLNPIELSKMHCAATGRDHTKLTWADFMHIDLAYLSTCNAIYMMPGWTKSNGAQCEYFFAKGMGIEIIDADPLPFDISKCDKTKKSAEPDNENVHAEIISELISKGVISPAGNE